MEMAIGMPTISLFLFILSRNVRKINLVLRKATTSSGIL